MAKKTRASKFVKNICKLTGHVYKGMVCQRCYREMSFKEALYEAFGYPAGLRKIAGAMSAPLLPSLDYRSMSRKLIKTDNLGPVDSLPVYDKDLPPRKTWPKKRAKRSS